MVLHFLITFSMSISWSETPLYFPSLIVHCSPLIRSAPPLPLKPLAPQGFQHAGVTAWNLSRSFLLAKSLSSQPNWNTASSGKAPSTSLLTHDVLSALLCGTYPNSHLNIYLYNDLVKVCLSLDINSSTLTAGSKSVLLNPISVGLRTVLNK